MRIPGLRAHGHASDPISAIWGASIELSSKLLKEGYFGDYMIM